MRMSMMCSALSLLGLFACVGVPEVVPDPLPEAAVELEIADEAPALLGGELCCIDYVCPTNGFEATGCKNGPTGPGTAFRACEQACGTYCEAGGWYCD